MWATPTVWALRLSERNSLFSPIVYTAAVQPNTAAHECVSSRILPVVYTPRAPHEAQTTVVRPYRKPLNSALDRDCQWAEGAREGGEGGSKIRRRDP